MIYHHRTIPPVDISCSGNHRDIHEGETGDGSVGRLKPASDWNRASRKAETAPEPDVDESDYEEGSDEVDQDGDEPGW